MSKKRVEKYIPEALNVLQQTFKNGKIPKEYNGYMSAFGAGLIQSGLKATVAIYENKNSETKEDKDKLTKILLQIIDPNSKEDSLLRYIIQQNKQNKNEKLLKDKIKDAAIAVKLAIRTFELESKET